MQLKSVISKGVGGNECRGKKVWVEEGLERETKGHIASLEIEKCSLSVSLVTEQNEGNSRRVAAVNCHFFFPGKKLKCNSSFLAHNGGASNFLPLCAFQGKTSSINSF